MAGPSVQKGLGEEFRFYSKNKGGPLEGFKEESTGLVYFFNTLAAWEENGLLIRRS